eukprot:2641189-Karenia_brevis.AAC.1
MARNKGRMGAEIYEFTIIYLSLQNKDIIWLSIKIPKTNTWTLWLSLELIKDDAKHVSGTRGSM